MQGPSRGWGVFEQQRTHPQKDGLHRVWQHLNPRQSHSTFVASTRKHPEDRITRLRPSTLDAEPCSHSTNTLPQLSVDTSEDMLVFLQGLFKDFPQVIATTLVLPCTAIQTGGRYIF